MNNIKWEIEPIDLYLKYTWKLSRNETDVKTNFIVKATCDRHTGYGEVAPNIRFDETPALIQTEFEGFLAALPIDAGKEETINLIQSGKFSQSLRCGLDVAFHHLMARTEQNTISSYFELPAPAAITTAYTIPVMDPADIQPFADQWNLNQFPVWKVKIARDSGLDALKEVVRISEKQLIVDPNEAMADVEELIQMMEKLKNKPIVFFEQPMPAELTEEYLYLKKHATFEVFADESITADPDWDFIGRAFDGVNVKMQKAGGYAKSSSMLKKAKELGLKTMIGCMVETTLGIGSAMQIAGIADYWDLDSFMIINNEPFHQISCENGVLHLVNSFPFSVNFNNKSV
jgi:L-alanine-DL-glutamate epimerase-like enolase superfamily enzyme